MYHFKLLIMKALFIILLITFLFSLIVVFIRRWEKKIKKQTYIINDKPVYLTKREIVKISKMKPGTFSWYRKRPGKNKGL